MKKLFVFSLLLFFIYSCNSDSKNKKPSSVELDQKKIAEQYHRWIDTSFDEQCLENEGFANILINSKDAMSMLEMFDSIYDKDEQELPIPALKKNYWLDSQTINIISSFLKRNLNSFDGIRFHFGADTVDNPRFPKPPYTKKTQLFIFPTRKATINGELEHVDVFQMISSVDNKPTPPYLLPYDLTKACISEYEKTYYSRRPYDTITGISLSKTIWMNKCVIEFMERLIITSEGKIDGFNVKLSSYLGTEPKLPRGAEGLKYASTIIIVPTSPGLEGDRSNWDIIDGYFNNNKKFVFNVLNHGELCPRNCPPADPFP